MKNKHRYLQLNDVSEGMILADDLLDKLGHILLPAGTSLTKNMLTSMAHHEVHQLSILTQVNTSAENEQVVDVEEKNARIHYLFRHTENEIANSALLSYILMYRSEELS